jgi:hypothetical protein
LLRNLDDRQRLSLALWLVSGGLIAVVFLISLGIYDYKDEGTILRFDAGDIGDFHSEYLFLHGQKAPMFNHNQIKDYWKSHSQVAGVDGVITKAIFVISDVDYTHNADIEIIAKVYKNGVEIGSCSVITSFTEHNSCEISLKENVKATDLISMTDHNVGDDMIFIKGIHGAVIIK